MTTVYELEGRLFQTRQDAESSARLYGYKTKITEIETDKDYDSFWDDFETLRYQGNSIVDSLEWAKL